MLMFGTDGRTIVGWNLSMAFSWDVLAVQNPHQCHLRVKKRWMVRCGSRASVGGVVGLVEKRRNFAFFYITWRQRLPLFARNILEQHKDPKCGSFFSPSNHKCLATLRLCWRCYSICYLVGSSFGKTYNYFLYFFMNRFHNESGTFSRTKMGKKSVLERSSLSNRLPWDLHSENCQLWTFEHLWFLSPTYRGTRVGWLGGWFLLEGVHSSFGSISLAFCLRRAKSMLDWFAARRKDGWLADWPSIRCKATSVNKRLFWAM